MDAGKSPKGKCRPWFSGMVIVIPLIPITNMPGGTQSAYNRLSE